MPSAKVQTVLQLPVRKTSRLTRKTAKGSEEKLIGSCLKKTSPGKRAGDVSTAINVEWTSPSKRNKVVFRTAGNKENRECSPSRVGDATFGNIVEQPSQSAIDVKDALSRLPLTPKKDSTAPNTPNKIGLNILSPSKSASSNAVISTPDKSSLTKKSVKALFVNHDLKETCSNYVVQKCETSQTPNSTPKMSLRLAKQEVQCYQQAKEALHTAIPDRLIGREKEHKEIVDYLESHISKRLPGSLYVSGAPGTGKTAVLSHVTRKLALDESCQVISVNCMSLPNAQKIYNKILNGMKGLGTDDCSSEFTKEACRQLEKSFCSKGSMIVLILDEMDQLDSKHQDVLYTLFEWPSLQNSRLVLIGIANALDLTDRILPRLQTRLNHPPKLIHFSPYTKDQIVDIIQDRLSGVQVEGSPSVLHPSSVQFCARRVSAVTGDMRKALDICRRSVEMVELEVRKQLVMSPVAGDGVAVKSSPTVVKQIGVPQIMKVVNDVYGSRVAGAESSSAQLEFPLQQKLALCTLLMVTKQGRMKEVSLGKLHDSYVKVCQTQGVGVIDQSEFLSICTLCESRGLMGLKRTKDTRSTKVSLKLDESELEHMLRDKTLMATILQMKLSKK